MAADRISQIVEMLNSLTVLEASQLSKRLQEEWGVSAAAPMAMAMPGAAAPGGAPAEAAAPVEEPTEFDVVLQEIGPNKLQVIKVVRELTGLGLKESKDAVEGAPSKIKERISKEEAEAARAKLADTGANIVVKASA